MLCRYSRHDDAPSRPNTRYMGPQIAPLSKEDFVFGHNMLPTHVHGPEVTVQRRRRSVRITYALIGVVRSLLIFNSCDYGRFPLEIWLIVVAVLVFVSVVFGIMILMPDMRDMSQVSAAPCIFIEIINSICYYWCHS